jgi:hypothetical protein
VVESFGLIQNTQSEEEEEEEEEEAAAAEEENEISCVMQFSDLFSEETRVFTIVEKFVNFGFFGSGEQKRNNKGSSSK